MKHKELNIFDVALESLADTEGFSLIALHKGEDRAETFEFESEEEFKEHFMMKRNILYSTEMVVPRNLNDADEVVIGDDSFYIDENELYLVYNGDLY